MSANKNLWLATASALVIFASAPAFAQNDPNVTIVQPDGPAEQAGEAVDNAAGNAADAAGDAAEAAGDAANAAGEAASDAAESADNAMEEATDTETTEAAPAEGTPVEGQIFEQSPDQYLASTLMDAVVMNSADEEIGDVNDLILTGEGQVEGVVIGVGGFLGVGEKDVAIELSRLQITEDEDGELSFMLDATSDELEAAPAFTTAEDAEAEANANMATPAAGTAPAAAPAPAAN